ncbi:MAG: class I SAM-dependent methyltransferase [Acidimicrobiia bacterium]|nr:class I SAM-dependent methyltransferase [Acidimicrobiia bacterium]
MSAPRLEPPALQWTGPDAFEIDGVAFVHALAQQSKPGRFVIAKPRQLVERYIDTVTTVPDATIVELGIFRGGSAVLTALVARPRRLVVADVRAEPVIELEQFVADRQLDTVVRRRYGLDQADRAQVAALLDEEIGEAPIDLVIDDASHRYEPTLASFEVIFPRLAVGGRYLIEDWRSRAKVAYRIREVRRGATGDEVAPLASPLGEESRQQFRRNIVSNRAALDAFAARIAEVLRSPAHPDHATVRADLEQIAGNEAAPEHPVVAALLRRAHQDPSDPAHDVVRHLVDHEPDSAVASAVLADPSPDLLPPPAPVPAVEVSLPGLAVELLRAHTARPDVIAEFRADPDWIELTRGSALLDESFSVRSLTA